MATTSQNYSSWTALTISLASLADNAWRESTVVDNTSNLYDDALVGGKITTGTTPTANTTIEVYFYALVDGTLYTGGASGTDAAYTADGEELLFPVCQIIQVDATSDQAYVFGPVSVRSAFGGAMPSKWGVVVKNDSAVALHATGGNHAISYMGIKSTIA